MAKFGKLYTRAAVSEGRGRTEKREEAWRAERGRESTTGQRSSTNEVSISQRIGASEAFKGQGLRKKEKSART